jgi:MYXO-CTERM domain-containing protein
MISRLLLATLVTGLAALTPGVADAAGPTEESEFSPFYQQLLLGFEDATLDTGWIPAGSPVQLRLYVDAANSITIDLPGAAFYDWRTEELRFTGDPSAGWFEYDIGLELEASVKVDVGLTQWTSDLLGPYDWGIEAAAVFTPYLLAGNPERPAMITDKTGQIDLVSIPLIPDAVILSGSLDIALFVEVEASLHCNRIEVLGVEGELTNFIHEGESLWIEPGDELDDLVLPATAYCQLQTTPTLILYPHLVVTVGFDDYDIAGIEIPIELPTIDEELQLDTIELRFPRWEGPEPEPEPDPNDTGGESGDDDHGDDWGGTETGDDELRGELVDYGCACSSADPGGGRGLGFAALGVLAFAGLRRSRRVAIDA